ncbi:hypothetical protein D3C80_2241430 [compost metagenome]
MSYIHQWLYDFAEHLLIGKISCGYRNQKTNDGNPECQGEAILSAAYLSAHLLLVQTD